MWRMKLKVFFAFCIGYKSHTQTPARPQTIYWPLMFSTPTWSSLYIWFSNKGSTNPSNFSHVAKRIYFLWFQLHGCELDYYVLLLLEIEVNWITFAKSHWHVNRAFTGRLLKKKNSKKLCFMSISVMSQISDSWKLCHNMFVVDKWDAPKKIGFFWWKLPLQT